MNLHTFCSKSLLLALPLFAALGACGSSDTTAPVATASSAETRGKEIVAKNVCTSCHGADLAGSDAVTKGTPNITPDNDFGIGHWTDEQIKASITTGVDDEGKMLCAAMKRYKMTDAELTDLVAYLRSVPTSMNVVATKCGK